MSGKIIVGIDPGKKGALVRLTETRQEAILMPLLGNEIDGHAISMWLKEERPDLVVVEKVHSMPKQGPKSMFTFGEGYGTLKGVLQTLGLPYILVTPQKWKGTILHGTAKDKNAAIQYVARKYPDLDLSPGKLRTPQDGIADACCLALYGKVYEY